MNEHPKAPPPAPIPVDKARPLSEILRDADADPGLRAIARELSDPTLADLVQELVQLQDRHREETRKAIERIVSKINYINSAIR